MLIVIHLWFDISLLKVKVKSCRQLKYLHSPLLSNMYFTKKVFPNVYFWRCISLVDQRRRQLQVAHCYLVLYLRSCVSIRSVFARNVFVRSVFLECIIKVYFFIWPEVGASCTAISCNSCAHCFCQMKSTFLQNIKGGQNFQSLLALRWENLKETQHTMII